MTLFSPTTTPQQHDVRVLPRVAKVIENTPRAPWVNAAEAKHEFGLSLLGPGQGEYDAIVVAVGHEQFRKLRAAGIRAYGKPGAVLYDVQYLLRREAVDGSFKYHHKSITDKSHGKEN